MELKDVSSNAFSESDGGGRTQTIIGLQWVKHQVWCHHLLFKPFGLPGKRSIGYDYFVSNETKYSTHTKITFFFLHLKMPSFPQKRPAFQNYMFNVLVQALADKSDCLHNFNQS